MGFGWGVIYGVVAALIFFRTQRKKSFGHRSTAFVVMVSIGAGLVAGAAWTLGALVLG